MKLLKRIFLILPLLFLVLTCSDDNDPETFILSVTITPEEGGRVSPDGGTFEEGAVIRLTATPSEGYVFKEWMGDLESSENPVSASMDADMNVTLVFVKSDSDNDGVPDDVDECLDTPEGEEVDESGCSASQKDLDSDGVLNENDQCSDTPEGEDVDENGCSDSQKDTDGDGISDNVDACAETPEGEDVDEDGCSDSQKDTDGDGITNDSDICPNTPEGEDVDQEGCPLTPPVYLDDNGVTIKAFEWSLAGQTGKLNGVVYTIVDETMLREMVKNVEDVTKVCTTKVTDMSQLFYGSTDFNADIGSWDVSNVTNMSGVFWNWLGMGNTIPNPFNQDLSYWDVSNVINMDRMFAGSLFNQEISGWDVSSVTSMVAMFSNSIFNQPISNWDVSNVVDMSSMFFLSEFNQPIGNWDVSAVIDMSFMFSYAAFNQDIGAWDVRNVTTMEGMFNSIDLYLNLDPNPFNQDISSWDVSNVINMSVMFAHSSFNQDLSGWDVGNVSHCTDFNMSSSEWTLPKPNFTNCNPD